FADTGNDRGAHLGIELAAGEVVEKEQRLGALHHEIVDRHRNKIDADCVVDAGLDGDLDLGADAVGGGDQDGVGKSGALEIEQAAEAADLGVGATPRRGAHQRLDQFHHAVPGVDVDPGLRISEAAPLICHGGPSFAPVVSYIRIARKGSIPDILCYQSVACEVSSAAGAVASASWGAVR